jgi:hypothetical protein
MSDCTYDEKGNAFYKHIIDRVPYESVGIILCTDINCECFKNKNKKYKQYPLYQPSCYNINDLQVAIIKKE